MTLFHFSKTYHEGVQTLFFHDQDCTKEFLHAALKMQFNRFMKSSSKTNMVLICFLDICLKFP